MPTYASSALCTCSVSQTVLNSLPEPEEFFACDALLVLLHLANLLTRIASHRHGRTEHHTTMPLKQASPSWLSRSLGTANKEDPSAGRGGGVVRHTTTGLTFSRSWLKHLANETVEIAQQGYYINQHGERVSVEAALKRAVQGSEHYHSSHVFSAPSTLGLFPPEEQTIVICYASSLQVAKELVQHYTDSNIDAHVGVLSSASAKNPSKFYRGTVSQEEVICRASLLYPCLAQYEFLPHHFYVINNKAKYKDSSSACAIFSPRVPVIRGDEEPQGALLDHYYECSVVSIPAPNAFVLGHPDDDDQLDDDSARKTVPKAQPPGTTENEPMEHITLQQALRDRIYRALSLFATHGCTDLVLCAFGCGVHGNAPEMVATLFRHELQTTFRGYFRTVVFAMQPSRTSNYTTFQTVFPEATAV